MFHKVMNIQSHLKKRSHNRAILGDAARVYNHAGSAADAWKRLEQFREKWSEREPRAVKNFCKDFALTLNYFQLPKPWWRLVRTTNMIERYFKELRRRIRPAESFKNLRSAERLLFALAREANECYFPRAAAKRKLPTMPTAPTARAEAKPAPPRTVDLWTTSANATTKNMVTT